VKRATRPRRDSRREAPKAIPVPVRAAEPLLALSVWVRLLRVHGLVQRRLRALWPSDLTLPQFDVLAQLDRHPGGLLPSELTQALLVTAGNVTGIVHRLEARGLVERLRVPHDRRAVRVRLTPRGRLRVAAALPEHARALERVMGGTPTADLDELRERLGALARNLEALST
jgi:DNA-binding MarR family transcriptional regulator